MTMISHIVKKDFRLLWPFAAALALVPFALVAVNLQRGHFHLEEPTLDSLLLFLEIIFYFGGGALILTLIHQDSLVGVRQDWLARPIRRRDLLAAKLIFVLVVVQLPMLLANLLEGLADGFSFGHAFLPAISQNLWLLLAFTLPVLAIASLTKNLTGAIAGAVAVLMAMICWAILMKVLSGGYPLGPTQNSAIAWIPGTAKLLIYLAGSSAVLVLQFFRRRLRTSIIVFAGTLALALFTELTPWPLAFRWQQNLSPSPSAAGPVNIAFDPSLKNTRPPALSGATPNLRGVALSTNLGNPMLYLPLQVSGLPPNAILKIDRTVVYVQASGTSRRIMLSTPNASNSFEIPTDTATASAPYHEDEAIHVRPRIYAALKNRRVTVTVQYSATLLRLASVNELSPVAANARLPGIGWCQTRLSNSQTEVHQCQHYSDCPLFCACPIADVANLAYAVSLMMTSLPLKIHSVRNLALCIPKPPPFDLSAVLAASVHDPLRPALRTCAHTRSRVGTCLPLAWRGESPAGVPDHSGEGQ